VVLGFKSDDDSKKKISGLLTLTSGSFEKAFRKDGVIISAGLARALGVMAGDEIKLRYDRKFEAAAKEGTCRVSAVCARAGYPDENVILMNDSGYYDLYYENLPSGAGERPYSPPGGSVWKELFAPEWILLKRTFNTEDYKKKYQEIARNKWKGTTIDVSTMYETASDILKLESVLNIITVSAVLVLFFIILLGVVNTLRMTIRERTREIGTVRAIGMRREAVRNIFILETFFLTLFSSVAGVILGFVSMRLLSLIPFSLQDNPLGMLLVNSRLYFLPTFTGIAGSVLLIILIAVLTAWFPARRAANLSPAQALRHYS